jgi:hypothetical protein
MWFQFCEKMQLQSVIKNLTSMSRIVSQSGCVWMRRQYPHDLVGHVPTQNGMGRERISQWSDALQAAILNTTNSGIEGYLLFFGATYVGRSLSHEGYLNMPAKNHPNRGGGYIRWYPITTHVLFQRLPAFQTTKSKKAAVHTTSRRLPLASFQSAIYKA